MSVNVTYAATNQRPVDYSVYNMKKHVKRGFGRFTRPIMVQWIDNNPRDMMVTEETTYVDQHGWAWDIEYGAVINGASVPWLLRRVFPIYVGLYRKATVFHDIFCTDQEVPSPIVHAMFYNAMRCSRVSRFKANLLWFAVRVFGPRFEGRNFRPTSTKD